MQEGEIVASLETKHCKMHVRKLNSRITSLFYFYAENKEATQYVTKMQLGKWWPSLRLVIMLDSLLPKRKLQWSPAFTVFPKIYTR